MWFEDLCGFTEMSVDDVVSVFEVDGEFLISLVNGRRMRVGRFETPSLGELRVLAQALGGVGVSTVREVVGDVTALHRDPVNAGATFQAASQFNMLEMASEDVTPEKGVSIYATDDTQGPKCAIACGAGTIWRNWFAEVEGGRGQTADRQINGLAGVSAALGHEIENRNGYAWPTQAQLAEVDRQLADLDAGALDTIGAELRVGVMWDTEVTLADAGHTVSQVYGSALPVGYVHGGPWERFARLVLRASYEATLLTAAINAEATGSRTVFLTLLGGGVFGNEIEWIVDAIATALARVDGVGLDVVVVSHRRPTAAVQRLLG